MFSTFKQRLLLGLYIFVILSIPIAAYLASQTQTNKSSASEKKLGKLIPVATPKPASTQRATLKLFDLASESASQASPTPEPSSPTIATTFGPTLSLKINIEGRPASNQKTKLFVGIAEGTLTSNPKFLLSFTVDVPASGKYEGLSLAGLSSGSTYTALLKGSAQIASSVTFTMSPTSVTNLNGGEAINLTTGDLNEDNVINSTDYSIVQKITGATENSGNWNENADLNKDFVINIFDLGMISKNIGKTGASGAWTSPLPRTATPSGSINPPPAGSPEGGSGYWIWIPK